MWRSSTLTFITQYIFLVSGDATLSLLKTHSCSCTSLKMCDIILAACFHQIRNIPHFCASYLAETLPWHVCYHWKAFEFKAVQSLPDHLAADGSSPPLRTQKETQEHIITPSFYSSVQAHIFWLHLLSKFPGHWLCETIKERWWEERCGEGRRVNQIQTV